MKKIILLITTLFLLAAVFLIQWWKKTEIEVLPPVIILTPEEAAIRHVREMETANFTIFSNSVEAIQAVALKDQVLVLVQYSGTRFGGDADFCETVLETKKTQLDGWKVNSGAGICHEEYPANPLPVTTGSSRGQATLQSPGYSTTYGLVRDPQIIKVVVTWEDGHIQPVEVRESTFFAVREGGFDWKKVEAFNNQNEIVYTHRTRRHQE